MPGHPRRPKAVGVLGCGHHLPHDVVSNEPVAAAAGVLPGWIESRTGIRARRVAAEDEAASDLAVLAAERALANAGVSASALRLIIVATSTPDSPQPPTASLVQHRLGAANAAAFDVNAVCSGFVFGMETARRMIADGGLALVIGVDVYSRILDPADRRTAVLFGDGAGACVLGPVPPGRGIVSVGLSTYGGMHDRIRVPAGGSRIPPSKESLLAGEHYFTMDGRGVREFVTDELPRAVHLFLRDNGIDGADVRHLVPHQANLRMLEEIVPSLGLPRADVHYTVEDYGNTGAASVPVTMSEAGERFREGDLVLLAAFGGGMSIGLALLRW
ncbi:ketoacyl-ACP synthase III [Lentzea tibetensis]|uniref:Ketoacyl-ACP synthase III n=2 Tax=Lentzea tibetensis TaxID=2591470 RepID=A0A563EMV9_9PSEU|nr:ketoacyl-ACP synthase III [Lentzea tibetensis]